MVSDGVQLRLRRNELRPTLHRPNPLRHLIPNLVGVASWLKAEKLHDTDKLKVNPIAFVVCVTMLCGSTSTLGLAQRIASVERRKGDDALLAETACACRTSHHDSILEQQLGGVSSVGRILAFVMAFGFHDACLAA